MDDYVNAVRDYQPARDWLLLFVSSWMIMFNAVRDYQSARDWLLLFVSSWMIMLMLCVTTSLRVTDCYCLLVHGWLC